MAIEDYSENGETQVNLLMKRAHFIVLWRMLSYVKFDIFSSSLATL